MKKRAAPHLRKAGVLALALLLVASSLKAASAQDRAVSLEHLEVALWPEFDRPAMLVILRFELPDEVALPAMVELAIPPEVGQPFAVAWQDAAGSLFDAPFSVTSQGVVSITIPQGEAGQLEYYDELTFEGEQRSYRYDWAGLVPLNGFSYEVQQPIGVTQFTVDPAPDSQAPGPFGLNYASAELGSQPVGSQLTIEVSYQKSGAGLSQPPPSGEPLAPSPTAAPQLPELLPYLLAGAGVVLVAAGAIYYWRGRPRSRPAPTNRQRAQASTEAELELSAVYCASCGAKAKVNDSFCRNCGTRLRQT